MTTTSLPHHVTAKRQFIFFQIDYFFETKIIQTVSKIAKKKMQSCCVCWNDDVFLFAMPCGSEVQHMICHECLGQLVNVEQSKNNISWNTVLNDIKCPTCRQQCGSVSLREFFYKYPADMDTYCGLVATILQTNNHTTVLIRDHYLEQLDIATQLRRDVFKSEMNLRRQLLTMLSDTISIHKQEWNYMCDLTKDIRTTVDLERDLVEHVTVEEEQQYDEQYHRVHYISEVYSMQTAAYHTVVESLRIKLVCETNIRYMSDPDRDPIRGLPDMALLIDPESHSGDFKLMWPHYDEQEESVSDSNSDDESNDEDDDDSNQEEDEESSDDMEVDN